MRLVNVRLDDRLLHGQVVYNWLRQLEPVCVMVAGFHFSDLQRTLLRASLPARYDLWLGNGDQAAAYLLSQTSNQGSAILLVSDVWQLQSLAKAGIVLPIITLGSQGWRPGRMRLTSQVSLAPDEVEVLESLAVDGVEFVFQALPCDAAVPWAVRGVGLN
jgi:mannose/fructose/N-acetylgalactosamine-specific phosphotransferase system component IIB